MMDSGEAVTLSYISLDRIFSLQDEVSERTRRENADRFEFAKECLELAINARPKEDTLLGQAKEDFQALELYQNDAVSTLINSLKLCLYGCKSDALMLLRLAVENIAVLSYVVDKKMYKTAKSKRGLKSQLKFNEIVKEIPDSARIEELWGRLSEVACHTTPARLANSTFKIGEQVFPRCGVALDPDGCKLTLGEIDGACLYLLRILRAFYQQHQELHLEAFVEKVGELDSKIESLKT